MWYWWSKKKDANDKLESPEIPDDLAQYLETKESQMSDREFKDLLRRQSDKHSLPSIDEEITNRQKQQQQQSQEQQISHEGFEMPTKNINNQPKQYLTYEVDKYRRENDLNESVLVNCSEIQSKFFKCLSKQTTWDRLQAVGKLENDACTALANFYVACNDLQKKAFGVFDYETLETVEEMKTARKVIDETFTSSFDNVDDVSDKKKFNDYSKKLRLQREEFYQKFGK